MNTYEVLSYFDVWGNESDGWLINNQMHVGNVKVAPSASDRDVLSILVKAGFLNSDAVDHVSLCEFGDMIEVDQKDNEKPLLGLMQLY